MTLLFDAGRARETAPQVPSFTCEECPSLSIIFHPHCSLTTWRCLFSAFAGNIRPFLNEMEDSYFEVSFPFPVRRDGRVRPPFSHWARHRTAKTPFSLGCLRIVYPTLFLDPPPNFSVPQNAKLTAALSPLGDGVCGASAKLFQFSSGASSAVFPFSFFPTQSPPSSK